MYLLQTLFFKTFVFVFLHFFLFVLSVQILNDSFLFFMFSQRTSSLTLNPPFKRKVNVYSAIKIVLVQIFASTENDKEMFVCLTIISSVFSLSTENFLRRLFFSGQFPNREREKQSLALTRGRMDLDGTPWQCERSSHLPPSDRNPDFGLRNMFFFKNKQRQTFKYFFATYEKLFLVAMHVPHTDRLSDLTNVAACTAVPHPKQTPVR
jgi:hypothetical protein